MFRKGGNKIVQEILQEKDPACRPEEIEWIEMSGKEFYRFVNSPEGKSRYFIDIDYVVLEVTEDEARAHKAEKSHSSYMKKYEDEFETLSLSCLENKDGDIIEEPLISEIRDVENAALLQIALKDLLELLELLDAADFHIIQAMYLSDRRKTLRQLSQETGIPVMTLQNRKKKLLSMLREKFS